MSFSAIWILTLPWLFFLRVKCHGDWSFFCFLQVYILVPAMYSPIFLVIFCNCPAFPSFRVKIVLQSPPKNVHHCPALSYVLWRKSCIHYLPWLLSFLYINFAWTFCFSSLFSHFINIASLKGYQEKKAWSKHSKPCCKISEKVTCKYIQLCQIIQRAIWQVLGKGQFDSFLI